MNNSSIGWYPGHIFLQTSGYIFLESSSPTFFLAGFLIVLGPLEISAEKSGARGFKKNVSRGLQKKMYPEVCRKMCPGCHPETKF